MSEPIPKGASRCRLCAPRASDNSDKERACPGDSATVTRYITSDISADGAKIDNGTTVNVSA